MEHPYWVHYQKILQENIFLETVKKSKDSGKRYDPVLQHVYKASYIEYSSAVFHYSLPNYLSEDLERVQKRALKIIFNGQPYSDCIPESNLQTLYARRQLHSERTFADVLSNQSHKLHHSLPRRNSYNRLRNNRYFNILYCKTKRFMNSFMIASASRVWTWILLIVFVFTLDFKIFIHVF